MCTVSFVKTKGKIVITSNRDENISRPSSVLPKNYIANNKNVIYPKDPKAGGTWYVIDENGTVLVLLNGAQEKHKVATSYRKSRGLIVLELICELSPIDFWDRIDLEEIEPFTMVLFQNESLYQLRWNGKDKEKLILNPEEKYIWSSSTLYSPEIRKYRSDLFYSFLDKNEIPTEEDIYRFHRYSNQDNTENGFVINRNNELKTLSITQTVIEQNKVAILHYDLIAQEDFTTSFLIV